MATSSPRSRTSALATDWLAAVGEMARRVRAFDWSDTPLGPLSAWPPAWRTATSICLTSKFPIIVWLGRELVVLYNDGYAPMLGRKHPQALGRPGIEVWSELWDVIGPMLDGVLQAGRATWSDDQLLLMQRAGYLEEAYFTWSYSPIHDAAGAVTGVFTAVTETTARVVSERRLTTVRELASHAAESRTTAAACSALGQLLGRNPVDLPFSLIYLLDSDGRTARLCSAAGIAAGEPGSPLTIDALADVGSWPLASVLESGSAQLVEQLQDRFGPLPGGAWPEPAHQAFIVPIRPTRQGLAGGFLVAGVSPRRAVDASYREFYELAAAQIATALTNAGAYESERRRAEELAELDRAKTTFFSNVSHEFRTPLTLILGPLEEALANAGGDRTAERERLELVHRNALRLHKLVNTLLDFSRIEAGRMQASYQPLDLAALTRDLASSFRSACEQAALELRVDCPPLGEPVYVDADMWEKVVLNLLSNAFKFTLDGSIEVALRRAGARAELRVRDTGIGIPAAEMPRLFERFHRAPGSRGRTQEGSGIGLALVRELVKLHGGEVRAESGPGGSTFTVSVPFGSAHLPEGQVVAQGPEPAAALAAAPYLHEAMRWLPDTSSPRGAGGAREPQLDPDLGRHTAGVAVRGRVLVADDNADLRQYLKRLLGARHDVSVVSDGEAALRAVREAPPDLVLADVMMPRLDGFALLERLRGDPKTRDVPVILLSARAGEESRVEGLEAGADDYLVKPFGARELLARVDGHLQLARLRRETSLAALRAAEALAETASSLARERERLTVALRAGQLGVYEWRIGDSSVWWSPEVYPVYGVDPASFTPTVESFSALVHPDDRDELWRKTEDALRRRETFTHEYRIVRPDGELRWIANRSHVSVSASGEVERITGVAVDVTERKRDEQRLAVLISSIDDHLVSYDRQWRYTFVNAAAARVLGRSREELLGRRVWELFPEAVGNPYYAALEQAAREQRVLRLEHYYAPFDRWFENHIYPSEDGVTVLATDITARKRAEAALRESDAERRAAVEALSVASRRKDEFLATLAHELRNPLATIRNAVEIQAQSGDGGAEAQAATAMLERQVRHMVRLVDDLLDVSRISRGRVELRRERLELREVIAQAIEANRSFCDSLRHELRVELPEQAVFVRGDAVRLTQVVGNLLNNACKFTERGGRLLLSLTQEGGEAVIRVRDNGIGIAPEQLGQVFEMFTQLDTSLERSHSGLGLGLTLVRRMVALHGGTVEAASGGLGLGSEFVVRLPLLPHDGGDRPTAAPDGAAKRSARSSRILVVDDNEDSADSLAMLLQLMGHDVDTAHEGGQALERTAAFRPHVAFLDIGLPGLNGYELAGRLRAQYPELTLIALTGWGQESDRRRSQEAGFAAHLVKPVDAADITRVLAGLGCG
jgi:PAS domain S-box-containing protein